MIQNASATFAPEAPVGVGNSHEAIATTDVNGDQRPDLVVTNANSDAPASSPDRLVVRV